MEPSDQDVDAFVLAHPGGGNLDDIAAVLGVTRQRANQLVNKAIEKALAALHDRGFRNIHDLPC